MPERPATVFGSFSSKMALSDIEMYKQYARSTSLDNILRSNVKEMKRLRRKIKKQLITLREYVIKESILGENTDPETEPTLASISADELVSNEGPIDLVKDAANYKSFEKNFIEPSFEGVVDVYRSVILHRRAEIENFVYLIRKSYLRVRELESLISWLHNLKIEKTIPYNPSALEKENRTLKSLQDYNSFVHKFLGIFTSIPTIKSSQEEVDRYNAYTPYHSGDYIYYRKKLLYNFYYLPSSTQDSNIAKAYFLIIENLPSKWVGIDTEATVTVVIKFLKLIGDKLNDDIIYWRGLIAREEGLHSTELQSQTDRVQNILNSDSFARIVDDKNVEQLREQFAIERDNLIKERSIIRKILERATGGGGSKGSKSEDINNLLDVLVSKNKDVSRSKVRSFVRNLLFRNGGVIDVDPRPSTANEEALRTAVRAEYGGNLPFEDETEIVSKEGKDKFVQTKNLVSVNGILREKSSVKEEDAGRELGVGDDVWGQR